VRRLHSRPSRDSADRARAGPLAGAFPLLSLRTNKADVVVGVDRAVAARLDASEDEAEKKWRVSGKCVRVGPVCARALIGVRRYALISFASKEA
jgi:hypothetical protein